MSSYETRKRNELSEREVTDPDEFTEICLGEVDFGELDAVPKFVISDDKYVVPQERVENQTGLARLCVSRPANLSEDEVRELLWGEGLFEDYSLWVVDSDDFDDERDERLYSIMTLDEDL